MTPADTHPAQPLCLPCRKGRCIGCLWESRPTGCSCLCAWLTADVLAHFPSLRRIAIEGDQDEQASMADDRAR